MNHAISRDDQRFIADLEACALQPAQFDHRAHIRAAYIYLTAHEVDVAVMRMRDALLAFLQHHAIPASKYHETITRAWILAVRHFMDRTPATASAESFIAANPRLLDSKIMLTHYSAEVLFSADARARFVEPDLDPIPRGKP
jgi:hypothetical protein